MQAPYDRERGQAPGAGDPSGWPENQQGHHPEQPHGYDPRAYDPHTDPGYGDPAHGESAYTEEAHGYGPPGYQQQPDPRQGHAPSSAYDPYLADGYRHAPYAPHDPLAQEGAGQAPYDQSGLYQQPAAPYAPDPRGWAPPPAPGPDGLSHRLPHGDDPARTPYTGTDGLMSSPGESHPGPREDRRPDIDDAFAHLFRDQEPAPGGSPGLLM
ncbi:hypothetical protein ACSNOC_21425, partial [Streptomyces sp. URMC 129]